MRRAERVYPPCKQSLRILDLYSAPILLGIPSSLNFAVMSTGILIGVLTD